MSSTRQVDYMLWAFAEARRLQTQHEGRPSRPEQPPEPGAGGTSSDAPVLDDVSALS